MRYSAICYIALVDRFIGHLESKRQGSMRSRECSLRTTQVCELRSGKRTSADGIADFLLETLDNLGVVRTPGQKLFHREFFCACLPHIYGSEEFERDRERILRRFGFERIRYEVLVVCPRRWGKTYGVSMFMAALLWCVPDMWISIFSTGQRASTSMLELIYKWIANLSDADYTLVPRKERYHDHDQGLVGNLVTGLKVVSFPMLHKCKAYLPAFLNRCVQHVCMSRSSAHEHC